MRPLYEHYTWKGGAPALHLERWGSVAYTGKQLDPWCYTRCLALLALALLPTPTLTHSVADPTPSRRGYSPLILT